MDQNMEKSYVYELDEVLNKKNKNTVMEPALAYRYDSGDKTLEDYLALPEGTRVELIDGVFFDMAAPTGLHQRLILKIAWCFEAFIEENGGSCVTLIAPFDVQLFNDNKTCVQPDILVVCDRDQLRSERLSGAPDFVVEVLSPSTKRKDISEKKAAYEKFGVREYWIIDPKAESIEAYILHEGKFELDGVYHRGH